MRVLIVEYDLFKTVGGGQTVYRRLIETNPDIEFWYYLRDEKESNPRPANCRVVPVHLIKLPYDPNTLFPMLGAPAWMWHYAIDAYQLARSVAGLQFDVIEIPDFLQFGGLLRPAFESCGVKFNNIALSLHGSVTTTHNLDWNRENWSDVPTNLMEQWQFRSVDIRYAISRAYIDEWQKISPLPVCYLDPRRFLKQPTATIPAADSNPPMLAFVGRPEKRKGPDIFLDLINTLPKNSYSEALLIGPTYRLPDGTDVIKMLTQVIQHRGLPVRVLPSMNEQELGRLFGSRTITMLPSRYDTLNLVALESLLSGCPTVIGSGAGVCRFLRDAYPNVPFLEIDHEHPETILPELQSLLADYDNYRRRLLEGLQKPQAPIGGKSLADIYATPSASDPQVNHMLARWYGEMAKLGEFESKPKKLRLHAVGLRVSALALDHLKVKSGETRTFVSDIYRILHLQPERSETDLQKKIKLYNDVSDHLKVDRVRLWNELARLQRMRGDSLLFATYKLRVMRALGADRFGDLPAVLSILRQKGFNLEARAAETMFGAPADADRNTHQLLCNALIEHRTKQSGTFQTVDDRRSSVLPRVAVIVSLYNAGPKLQAFLTRLRRQTLVEKGAVEVILVDSGSPSNEGEVFRAIAPGLGLNIIYVRTAARETIQNAWNRGILLSRAPYLCFLGADETLEPQALEVLANELDANSDIDWVTGNSVVTDVTTAGEHIKDVMTYDRSGYFQDLVYLETCYLSWVGALYRRSIHERFGFYDETFRAAGDTEFKCRIMPRIKSKAIPANLGIFLNYPEDRTTASPTAELEDLRAWYLHRTLGGVRYAFAHRSDEELIRLILSCLHYRKSYSNGAQRSTDVDYAVVLLQHLAERGSKATIVDLLKDMVELQRGYRAVEYIDELTIFSVDRQLEATTQLTEQIRQKHLSILTSVQPIYSLFNDNRYEQHHWPWRTANSDFTNKIDNRYLWI